MISFFIISNLKTTLNTIKLILQKFYNYFNSIFGKYNNHLFAVGLVATSDTANKWQWYHYAIAVGVGVAIAAGLWYYVVPLVVAATAKDNRDTGDTSFSPSSDVPGLPASPNNAGTPKAPQSSHSSSTGGTSPDTATLTSKSQSSHPILEGRLKDQTPLNLSRDLKVADQLVSDDAHLFIKRAKFNAKYGPETSEAKALDTYFQQKAQGNVDENLENYITNACNRSPEMRDIIVLDGAIERHYNYFNTGLARFNDKIYMSTLKRAAEAHGSFINKKLEAAGFPMDKCTYDRTNILFDHLLLGEESPKLHTTFESIVIDPSYIIYTLIYLVILGMHIYKFKEIYKLMFLKNLFSIFKSKKKE